jgi:hypothetical protein
MQRYMERKRTCRTAQAAATGPPDLELCIVLFSIVYLCAHINEKEVSL